VGCLHRAPAASARSVARPAAAVALVGTLAVIFIALALAGTGPLGGVAGRDATAKDTCHVVQRTREVKFPAVVEDRHGHTRIVYTPREITRSERVCR
jgi:hypothetical protein